MRGLMNPRRRTITGLPAQHRAAITAALLVARRHFGSEFTPPPRPPGAGRQADQPPPGYPKRPGSPPGSPYPRRPKEGEHSDPQQQQQHHHQQGHQQGQAGHQGHPGEQRGQGHDQTAHDDAAVKPSPFARSGTHISRRTPAAWEDLLPENLTDPTPRARAPPIRGLKPSRRLSPEEASAQSSLGMDGGAGAGGGAAYNDNPFEADSDNPYYARRPPPQEQQQMGGGTMGGGQEQMDGEIRVDGGTGNGRSAPNAGKKPTQAQLAYMRAMQSIMEGQKAETKLNQLHSASVYGGASFDSGVGNPNQENFVPKEYQGTALDPAYTSEADRLTRETQWKKAGDNPYDEFHGAGAAASAPGLRHPTDQAGAYDIQEGSEKHKKFNEFMSKVAISDGLQPITSFARKGAEAQSYAHETSFPMDVKTDATMPIVRQALSDFDWRNRPSATHVLRLYPWTEWVLVAVTFGIAMGLFNYQKNNDYMEWWDEFLGIDLRFFPEAEPYFLFLVSAMTVRLFIFHPLMVGMIVATRWGRVMRGLPMGPP